MKIKRTGKRSRPGHGQWDKALGSTLFITSLETMIVDATLYARKFQPTCAFVLKFLLRQHQLRWPAIFEISLRLHPKLCADMLHMSIMRCCIRIAVFLHSLFKVSGFSLLLQNETSSGLIPLSKYVLHAARFAASIVDREVPAPQT